MEFLEGQALSDWYRQFGDPNGSEYLTLDQINAGLELVDATKAPMKPEETLTGLATFFGFHPPSIIDYAISHTRSFVPDPNGHTLAWFDGLWVGCAIYMLLAKSADDDATVPE